MQYHGNMIHVSPGGLSSTNSVANNPSGNWSIDGTEAWAQPFTPISGSSSIGVIFWYNNTRGSGTIAGDFYLVKYRKGGLARRQPVATSQAFARCPVSAIQSIGANKPWTGTWQKLHSTGSTTVALTSSSYCIVFWPDQNSLWPSNVGITFTRVPSSLPSGNVETVRYFDKRDTSYPGYSTANGASTAGAYFLSTAQWYDSHGAFQWSELSGRLTMFSLMSQNKTMWGQPYHTSSYYATNNIQWQKVYLEETGALNVGVYLASKTGTPVRLKYILATPGHNTAAGYTNFKHSATFNTDSWTASGWSYASTAFSTPFNAGGSIGRNVKIGIVTGDRSGSNYWSIKASDVVHRGLKCASASSWAATNTAPRTPNYTRDLVLQYHHYPTAGFLSGQITDYVGDLLASTYVNVRYATGFSVVATARADANGYYSVRGIQKYRNYVAFPHNYDWDYTPQYRAYNTFYRSTAVNWVQSSESLWWGATSMSHRGKEWAFRERVYFSDPHLMIGKNYTIKVPFQTGYLQHITHTAFFNESVGSGSGPQIIHANGKTHAIWRSKDAFYTGATYDWSSHTWTEKVVCSTSYSLITSLDDTHISPAICYSPYDQHIYMTIGTHDTGVLKILRSRYANDLLMGSTAIYSYGGNITYPELLAYDKYLYISFRNYVSQRSARGLIILDVSTSPVIARTCLHTVTPGLPSSALAVYRYQDSWNNADYVSLYSSGITMDSRGTLYQVITWHDDYGNFPQYGRAISCMYSPVTSSGFAGTTWYSLNGHTCALPKAGQPLFYMKPTYSGPTANPFVIYTSTSDRDYGKLAKYSYRYFSNVYSVFCHPTESFINERGDRIQRPYFTFISTDSAESIYAECRLYVATFNTSVGAASLSTARDIGLHGGYKMGGWLVHTISHLSNGSWQKGWKNRHVGNLAIDTDPTIHVYGMIKPTDLTWGGGELGEWYSDNQAGYYSQWKFRKITDRSGYGIGMPMAKRDYSNNALELVFGRGNDVFYYAGLPKYGRVRSDGLDIRVVYSSASSQAVEIDRVLNLTNYASSEIYFRLRHTIPIEKQYDRFGNYYVYYGRYSTSQSFGGPNPDIPKADPTKTMIFFEGFETYSNNTDIVGSGGWYTKGAGAGKFRVRDSITEHTNKLFSGDKSLQHSSMATTNSILLIHTIPALSTCAIKIGRVYRTAACFVGIGHSVAGRNQFVYLKHEDVNNKWVIMASTLGSGGCTPWSTVDPNYVAGFYNKDVASEDIFYLNRYGVNIYDSFGTFIDGNTAYGRSYSLMRNKLTLHTINQIIIGQDKYSLNNATEFVDHIRITKALSTPRPFYLLG